MSAEPQQFTPKIRLQAAEQGAAPADLSAEFRFAADKPAVGEPGKKPGDLLIVPREAGGHTVIVSLGKAGGCTPEMARRAGGALGKWLVSSGAETIDLDLDTLKGVLADQTGSDGASNTDAGASGTDAGASNTDAGASNTDAGASGTDAGASGTDAGEFAAALLEGLSLGAYHFGRYKGRAENGSVTVRLRGEEGAEALRSLAERVGAVTSAVLLARDISHEPANVINPVTLAERAAEVARQRGLKLRVVDESELKALGAGAILAVGQGSQTPPRLIVLEYPGDGSPAAADARPVALVGKAITFDTGGYSIKSTEGIVGMKYDKCGGADVLAVMQAAADLKLKTPLVGVIGAAENMISGQAYRPDDIITTLSGKTVEIISTDAEGRLVLADALTFVQREYQPRAIIDLATLTGGVMVALGRVRAGLLSNDDELAGQLFEAGEKTYERLWRLPLDEDFTRAIEGDDADLKNSGGREGHCILGGAFLQEFIEAGTPWAHLDIAAVSATQKDLPYAPKGATGFGVRLLVEFLKNGEQ